MPRCPAVFLAVAGALALSAPSLAQREWRKTDGPFTGLKCEADETVVTIVDGVKCQKLPTCPPGQALAVGRDGFRCAPGMPTGNAPRAPSPTANDPPALQRYLAHEWNFAYAEVPWRDGDGRRVVDLKSGKQGADAICIVWRVGWHTAAQHVPLEHAQVARWYTGWGYRIDLRQGMATLDMFSAPMVQDTPQGRRRVGPDEIVGDLTVTVPLATSRPPGCTEKWLATWRERNDLPGGVAGVIESPASAQGMSGTVPSLGLTAQGLRFFAGPPGPVPPPEKRDYDELFFYNAAPYIYWELALDYVAVAAPAPFTIEEVWRGPGVSHRAEHKHTLDPGRTSTQIVRSARLPVAKSVSIRNPVYEMCIDNRNRAYREGRAPPDCDPNTSVTIETWPQGDYQVDLYINKQYIAAGWFRMGEKSAIYAEVDRKARDRSAPSNAVSALSARVDAVRFFDQSRKHATHFPRDSGWIAWQIHLTHHAPGRWVPVIFEALLYGSQDGQDRLLQRRVLGSAVPATLADSWHFDSFSWVNDYYFYRTGATAKTPGRWLPGRYRLDVFVGRNKVASGGFTIE